MLGAIAGDILGSTYEFHRIKTTEFPLFPEGSRFTDDSVLTTAEASATVTHNHPEGIKGAQAVALAIFLARQGTDKTTIAAEITSRFGYDLDRTTDEIRPGYCFEVSCQKSVPESLICFLESNDWLGAVRLAISLGGDADTMGCIAGAVAEAFYGSVPVDIAATVTEMLPTHLGEVVTEFNENHRQG